MSERLIKLKQRFNTNHHREVTPYDLFIVAITLLSLVNAVLYTILHEATLLYTIGIIDLVLSALFFVDFLRLFFSAQSKAQYFFRDFGWADLLASLPFPQLKILRIFRLIKAYGIIRRAGIQGIKRGFTKNRASAALLIVVFTIIILLEFGSVGILILEEGSPDANITSASDAIWWVYVTITTVGYGDQYPVTNAGRAFATIVMLVGVGLFGVVTGFLANKFLPTSNESDKNDVALNKDAAIAQMREEIKEIRQLLEKQADTSRKSPKSK